MTAPSSAPHDGGGPQAQRQHLCSGGEGWTGLDALPRLDNVSGVILITALELLLRTSGGEAMAKTVYPLDLERLAPLSSRTGAALALSLRFPRAAGGSAHNQ